MKEKYYWIIAVLLMSGSSLSAQNTYVNEQMTSARDLSGTARYVGMGGALGALGADISVISANPAGIGLFRRDDVVGTLGVMTQADKSSPNDFFTHFSLDQLGFVFSSHFDAPVLKYLNLAVNFQRKANYNHSYKANNAHTGGLSQTHQLASMCNELGFSDENGFNFPSELSAVALFDAALGGFLEDENKYLGQRADANTFTRVNKGSLESFDFNVSANLSERFYVGATLGVDHVNYYSESYYTEFLMEPDGPHDYQTFSMQSTTGYGINGKFGFIVRPIAASAFRLGFTVETPTVYTLETFADMYVKSHYDDNYIYNPGSMYTYYGRDDNYLFYSINTPWRFRVSAGHTISNFFAIGAEYEYVNYPATNMGYVDYDGWGGSSKDHAMNLQTKKMLQAGHNFKVGMEFRFAESLYGRMGYNYYRTAYKNNAYMDQHIDSPAIWNSTYTDYMNTSDLSLYTLGLGYKFRRFYIDMVYKLRVQSGNFYAFDATAMEVRNGTGTAGNQLAPVHVNLNQHQVGLTFGYKF